MSATEVVHASLSPSARPTVDYSAFGGVLRSELPFPELTPAAGEVPSWTLSIEPGRPPDDQLVSLGERRVASETYRLSSTPTGVRLEYSHAGWFDISADGTFIKWYPTSEPQLEIVRTIVLGPVLALALEAAGLFCLHGSAVAVAGHGVAFIAPKHHGKSTLALALASAGASFISDDTLAVTAGLPVMLRPGVGSARLWGDAANALRVSEICGTMIPGVKLTATGFRSGTLARTAVRLGAVYVLEPQPPEHADQTTRRIPLSAGAATIAFAHHAKLPDSLVGYRLAGKRLAGAGRVAKSVPAFRLLLPRRFELLPAVVDQLFAWHGDAGHAVV